MATDDDIELQNVIATLQRLAETQPNLPVPMRNDERAHLRRAAALLRALVKSGGIR